MLEKERLLRQSGLTVFDRKAIANILEVGYASTNPILHRLLKAGVLTRLKRDCYVLTESMQESTRKIANELVKPSSISLWTALSDAGLTTHVPRAIQSVTPKRAALIEHPTLPSFQFVHLPVSLYVGATPDSDGVRRMPPEKALLDLLYVQEGAVDWESLKIEEFDRTLLARVAERFPARVRSALAAFPLAL